MHFTTIRPSDSNEQRNANECPFRRTFSLEMSLVLNQNCEGMDIFKTDRFQHFVKLYFMGPCVIKKAAGS